MTRISCFRSFFSLTPHAYMLHTHTRCVSFLLEIFHWWARASGEVEATIGDIWHRRMSEVEKRAIHRDVLYMFPLRVNDTRQNNANSKQEKSKGKKKNNTPNFYDSVEISRAIWAAAAHMSKYQYIQPKDAKKSIITGLIFRFAHVEINIIIRKNETYTFLSKK